MFLRRLALQRAEREAHRPLHQARPERLRPHPASRLAPFHRPPRLAESFRLRQRHARRCPREAGLLGSQVRLLQAKRLLRRALQ